MTLTMLTLTASGSTSLMLNLETIYSRFVLLFASLTFCYKLIFWASVFCAEWHGIALGHICSAIYSVLTNDHNRVKCISWWKRFWEIFWVGLSTVVDISSNSSGKWKGSGMPDTTDCWALWKCCVLLCTVELVVQSVYTARPHKNINLWSKY